MNSTKIIFVVALIAFCCINFSYTLKCFVCNSKVTCENARLYECNSGLANETRLYLQQFHSDVNPNSTSPHFQCFREHFKTSTGEYFYKNCAYSTLDGCRLHLNPYINSILQKRSCDQCSNKNGCNPADRVNVNVMNIFAAISIAGLLRYLWR